MARFVSDLVRPARPRPPTVTVFYDGGAPEIAALVRRLSRLAPATAPLLWRDLAAYPAALTLWGVGEDAWRRRLFAVDRKGVLRRGARALAAVAREIPVLPRAIRHLPMPAAIVAGLARRWRGGPAAAEGARP